MSYGDHADRHERGLFTNQLLREHTGRSAPSAYERLRHAHADAYQRLRAQVCPLPGARELLAALTDAGTRWPSRPAGRMETAAVNLEAPGRSGQVRGRHSRRREVRQTCSRPVHCGGIASGRADRTYPSWSATAFGTCSPRGAAARWASVLLSGGYGMMNWNAQARCEYMKTRLTCCAPG